MKAEAPVKIRLVASSKKHAFEQVHIVQIVQYVRIYVQNVISVFTFRSYILFNDSVSGQWRPWSDCTDGQADLGLHCLHMPKDMFLHGAAQKVMVRQLHMNFTCAF